MNVRSSGAPRESQPVWMLLLAGGAEKGGAAGLHDALHLAFATAGNAGLSLAVIDPKIMLEGAKLAVGPLVVAQRGAAGLDRILQHRLDRLDQACSPLVRRAGFAGDG